MVQISSGAAGVTAELRDAHQTDRFVPYLRAVWSRRSYMWYVATSELRSRQAYNVLGNLWYLLNPIISVAIYYLIFGVILGIDRGVDNYILYLAVGVFLFQITQRSTMAAAQSVVRNLGLIRAFSFPRVILPLTATLVETLASVTSILVVYVVALATGQSPRWEWVLLAPIFVVLTAFNAGLGMFTARATTHVRDLQQVLPFVFRLLFYASGVIFNVSAYAEGSRKMELIFALNPVYCFLTVARWAMLGGDDVGPVLVVSGLTWTVVMVVVGFTWFRAGEARYGRD